MLVERTSAAERDKFYVQAPAFVHREVLMSKVMAGELLDWSNSMKSIRSSRFTNSNKVLARLFDSV